MPVTAVPEFFERFPMRRVRSEALDAVLTEGGAPALSLLFLWGHDCVNCDLAKREILLDPTTYDWPQVRWLHDDVYEDRAMALRFGLHGVPTFLVFRGSRRLGRISPWPGGHAFREAITRQIEALSA